MSDSALSPIPVSGNTNVYLIVGDPVDQVQAPLLFNTIFASQGIDAVLVPAHVAPFDADAFVHTILKARNVRGLWVSIPHKVALLEGLDACSPAGQRAGAINAIRRTDSGLIEGDLFDGYGLLASLRHFGIAFINRRVLIVGAGGAACAIAAALTSAEGESASEVNLFDPDPAKAATVALRLGSQVNAKLAAVHTSDPRGYDLVINASPLGMKLDDPMPCDVARLEPHAAVIDIVMKNQPTALVRAARARGLPAQPGFEMLIQQVPLYLEFFGYNDAAKAVRQDGNALRQLLYPRSMQAEIGAS